MLSILLILKLIYYVVKFFISIWNIITPLPFYGHALGFPAQIGVNLANPIVALLPPGLSQFRSVFTYLHAMLHLFLPFMAFFQTMGVIRDTVFSLLDVFPTTYDFLFGSFDFLIKPILSYTDGQMSIFGTSQELFIEICYSLSQILTRYYTPFLNILIFIIHAVEPIL